MKTIAEYIKKKRMDQELSASELARNAGVTGEHILYIEKGERKTPSFEVVMKILRALHVDPMEFMLETGCLPVNVEPASYKKLRLVPVISWVAASGWRGNGAPDDPPEADEWTDTDVKGERVFALRVKGDCMEPEFTDGDIIIVNPHVEVIPGDYVVAKKEEEAATFKQLQKIGKTLFLHPLNRKYPDIELKRGGQYRIIGKVVRKEKKY